MSTKLAAITTALYKIVTGLVPLYEPERGFEQWQGPAPLEQADPGVMFRNFRVAIPSIGKGSLQDGSTTKHKKASVQIQVLYPQVYYLDSDEEFLGVELLRASDGNVIENALCFKRPLLLQEVGGVRSIKWLSSSLVGLLWVVSIEVEYSEVLG